MENNRKLKVALCFSGQLRNVEKTWANNIKPNILDCNPDCEIDVFMHSWYSNEEIGQQYTSVNWPGGQYSPVTDDVIKTVYMCYNPKKLLLEKQVEFDEKNFNERKPGILIVKYSLSKCSSMFRVNELKKSYEKENNFIYDYVMTIRTDLGVQSPIIFNQFDPKLANMSMHGVWNGIGTDVTHCILNSSNADLYVTVLDHIDEYFRNGVMFVDEQFFHRHLEAMNIPINRTSQLNNYILVRN